MSREIKFRFYSKLLKHFVIPNDNIIAGAFKDENMIVMQYVGLKDKNGKEIYEGDIFKGTWNNIAVEWIECDACFGFTEENDWRTFTRSDLSEMKIIGNIYSNPELLNE